MMQLVTELGRFTGRTVIDKTGFEGKFNAHLEFAMDEPAAPGQPERAAAATEATGPSLFTALEEQLGLKLESTKGRVEILVIDHLEKASEN